MVPPLAAYVLWRFHGQALAERAAKYGSEVGKDELAWQMDVMMRRLARANREVREALGSGPGHADGPPGGRGAESDSPRWSPGESMHPVCTTEVAEMLSITERQVRRLIRDGRLSATLVGSRWLIDLESVEEELLRREMRGGAA